MSEKMIFCLGEGRSESKGNGYQKNYMVFNKKVTEEEYEEIEESLSDLKITATHWVDEDDMTEDEKDDHDVYKSLGGYLKYVSYEDAWKNFWDNASQKDKDLILDIPQFDAKIFLGITGIDPKKDSKADRKKKELIDKAEELKVKANELIEQANKL
jgi:hypothetical protein